MKAPIRWAKGVDKLLVPIDTVQQHPRNPNNGDVDELVTSIKQNGFNTVLTVDEKTGYILAGNHRYQALCALGATHVPVVYAVDTGEAKADVRYLIADNQLARLAQMDEGLLLEHLQELQASEIGLLGTGWDDDKLEALMQAMLAEDDMGDEQGFGAGEAPEGVFQVVLDFEDADERDMAWIVLQQEYGSKARTVNL